jgi:hypothetical protein
MRLLKRVHPGAGLMPLKPLILAAAIIGALVAGAILVAFRWQITAAPGHVYRLDRWTGRITVCDLENPVVDRSEPARVVMRCTASNVEGLD